MKALLNASAPTTRNISRVQFHHHRTISSSCLCYDYSTKSMMNLAPTTTTPKKSNTSATLDNNFNQTRLEWKQGILSDGTVFYKHPTWEEVVAEKQRRIEMTKNNSIQGTLTAEQIQVVRHLHEQDPEKYSSAVLAAMFRVKPIYVAQVIDRMAVQSDRVRWKAKKDIYLLKKQNRNRPRKGTKEYHDKY
ncbi:hypothetical protein FDP41_000163 [Naegleria fowleri]|uniref:Uncharacterized protein n=1 Tax=Naegleria fowleri TaxID=5763 RepID=A0A6A5CEV6_NAEFO|nr:uncharacterized protein FDP41_000163 [Naegleria fowleri]KAF0985124.1 hypothetical protein FDP41_000163 [Naegleria fowleri]CAG4717383.1 unnamed protein product [Naegleria fowleri]